MTFTFGLQKILEFREMQEDEAKSMYEHIQKKLSLHLHILTQLEEKVAEAEASLYGDIANNSNMLWLQEQYIQSLKADIATAVRYKISLEEELREQQSILLELAKKTKTMDTLKTKRKQKFLATEQCKEQQSLDEMTTMRFKHETR